MFGIGLIVVLIIATAALLWLTSRVPTRLGKALFLLVVVGTVSIYPWAYKFSASHAQFLALCEQPERYQVLQTRQVDVVYLDRDLGQDCQAGPGLLSRLPYAGFDCAGRDAQNKPATLRHLKKADWAVGCGIGCFDATVVPSPEVSVTRGHRQGYLTGAIPIVTYDRGRLGAFEPSDAKLKFADTLILDSGTVMAYTRSYTYYPYGNGWAKLLGAASGSAPSQRCKTDHLQWNVLDVYKPRAAAFLLTLA